MEQKAKKMGSKRGGVGGSGVNSFSQNIIHSALIRVLGYN